MGVIALFAEFCKTGFFAVGGGLATLPFLFHMAERYVWLTPEIIASGQAIAQALPGAIGVNMSAYTGFFAAGVLGAVTAAFGLVLPSIAVITIVARMFESFKKNSAIKAAFSGLRPASCGLLASAAFGVIRRALADDNALVWYKTFRLKETLLFLALFFIILKFKPHPAILIIIAGAVGVFFPF